MIQDKLGDCIVKSCICNKCGFVGAVDQFRNDRKTNCKKCRNERDKVNESMRKVQRKHYYKNGGTSMVENRTCSSFLGVHIAERMLSHVFNEVEIMPFGNQGYDFVCNRGKKIDVKSSCLRHHIKRSPSWVFTIRMNKIADYFLCLAFDNRTNLNPLHAWLIPGHEINNLMGAGISITKIDKWDQYRLSIDKILTCCNTLKEECT